MVFPQPMSRPKLRPDDSQPDPASILEQHILAGFPPDLALDLVLNELVVRAAEATHASAAALALLRGDEMVCRAATGQLAPDLGVPLNTRDGLSGACLQTRQPQLSVDTEFDPRIDPIVSRRLGIRSILIVPVFDTSHTQFTGMLEVFSSSPAAFSHNDQKLLEAFADECARVRQTAIEMGQREPAAGLVPTELIPRADLEPSISVAHTSPRRPRYEAWALVLGALTILATIAVSFLIGSRVGWFPGAPAAQVAKPTPASSIPAQPAAAKSAAPRAIPPKSATNVPPADELVVYEKGKVVFRMKPAQTNSADGHQTKSDDVKRDSNSIVEASSTTKIATSPIVWLSPTQAETRLLSRPEPQYPPEALAAHQSGTVVLEVQVAEDGTVSNVRTLSGDPLLATAATEAVHNWRYEPYRRHDRPSQFQTDVTLSFTLPN
jgi:TonB family protein